jgi:hypothetical protein
MSECRVHEILELVEETDLYGYLLYQCKECGMYIDSHEDDFRVYSDNDGN